MNEQELRQIFRDSSDCYADTGRFENDGSYSEGDVIQSMTEDRFIDVLNQIFTRLKANNENLNNLLEKISKRDIPIEFTEIVNNNFWDLISKDTGHH